MTFPLPLVPFEEYMLIDDRPMYPMSFFLKLTFSGVCDSNALSAALPVALKRHPLLLATIQKGKNNRLNWTHTYRQTVDVLWLPHGGCVRATAIDLFSEPGLRISAQQLDAGTELTLQFHHSSCDAIGALRFIEDLLVAYAAEVNCDGQSTPFRPIDVHRLRGRGRFGMTRWGLLRAMPSLAVGLLGARQFLMRQPVSIVPIEIVAANAKLPGDFPATLTHQFSEPQTSDLLAAARLAGAKVNDLLIRDLFLALGEFRENRVIGNGGDWLRLSIPMNLRDQDDEMLPAANVVGMVFLDRRPREFDDGFTLLNGIGREMRDIKQNRLGLIFPLALRFLRSLPGAIPRLQRMTKKQVCNATAVLSNLGQPLCEVPLPRHERKIIAGEMILERIKFLPPVRPRTSAALGMSTYAGRLDLALHFNPREITSANATELLNAFIARLSKTAK